MNFLSTRLRLWLAALLFLLMVPVTRAWAQAPAWQWATSPGAGLMYNFGGIKTAVDAAGNVLVIGCFSGTATFGSTTLTCVGDGDVFVTKVNPNGAYLWAVQAGGPGIDYGYGVAVDGGGNVYITGAFGGPSASFGPTTLASAGFNDMFIAKLSSSGAWQWANRAGGGYNDEGKAVAVDSNGNAVVTGSFGGSASFGPTTLTSAGHYDLFVVKYAPSGAWQWAASAGGTTDAELGIDLTVDGSDNVLVTGGFRSYMATFGATTLTNAGAYDVFVAKLTSAGVWAWATSAGGMYDDFGTGVRVEGSGAVAVTGEFNDAAMFGAISLMSAGYADMFVAKLASSGSWQWVTHVGGAQYDSSSGIAVDGSDNLFVSGSYHSPVVAFGSTLLPNSGKIFVAKLTPTNAWQWAVSAGGSSNMSCANVVVDANGNVVFTGDFSGTAVFGSTTLTNSVSQSAIFIASLSQSPTGIVAAEATPALTLSPNPAPGTPTHLTGATPHAPLTVLDGLGRQLLTTTADATGAATLDLRGQPAGLYLVRAGATTRRLVLE